MAWRPGKSSPHEPVEDDSCKQQNINHEDEKLQRRSLLEWKAQHCVQDDQMKKIDWVRYSAKIQADGTRPLPLQEGIERKKKDYNGHSECSGNERVDVSQPFRSALQHLTVDVKQKNGCRCKY